MGYGLTMVPFFTDDITIEPHTATHAKHIGHRVSIAQFAKGRPVSLSKRDDNGVTPIEPRRVALSAPRTTLIKTVMAEIGRTFRSCPA